MISSAFEDAAIAFLEGDSGDVRTAVNAEYAALLPAGSVVTTRPRRGADAPRRGNPPPLGVEIVPRGQVPRTDVGEVGIGCFLLDLRFDLEVTLRRKDLSKGREQLDAVREIAASIARRYGPDVLDLDVTGYDLNRFTTSWVLAGIVVGTNTEASGLLYVRIAKDTPGAGTHRVRLYKATGAGALDLVAEGSGINGATVVLAAQNASGLTGTVVLGTVTASETTDTHKLRVHAGWTWGARFLRSTTGEMQLDDAPEAGELVRAIVPVTFTFLDSR